MNKILELYNNLEVKLYDDPYGRSLKYKSGNSVKCFKLQKHFNLLEKLELLKSKNEEIKKVLNFLIFQKYVYFIPLEFPDNINFGFSLKSVKNKSFYKYRMDDKYPLVYGFSDFKNFRMNEDKIILIEGIKDAQTVKLLYPFVLAYMSSQPSKKLFEYLLKISNNLIFIPDNDEAGLEIRRFKKYNKFKKYFCNVSSMSKDYGEYWDNYDEKYLNEIRMIKKMEGLDGSFS